MNIKQLYLTEKKLNRLTLSDEDNKLFDNIYKNYILNNLIQNYEEICKEINASKDNDIITELGLKALFLKLDIIHYNKHNCLWCGDAPNKFNSLTLEQLQNRIKDKIKLELDLLSS